MNKRISSFIIYFLCAVIFCLPTYAVTDIPETKPNTAAEAYPPLTPAGNMTVTDDLYQLVVEKVVQTGDDGTQVIESNIIENKQFIIVQTRSGAEFYIIIDRSQGADNVYFLNQVDDDDLFALLEVDDSATLCTCEEKCIAGRVNTDCYVCKMNMKSCAGKEPVKPEKLVEAETETESVTEKLHEEKANLLPIILVVVIICSGVAVFFIKFKKKPKAAGTVDLDDYDYSEEDDVEIADDENEEDSETNK